MDKTHSKFSIESCDESSFRPKSVRTPVSNATPTPQTVYHEVLMLRCLLSGSGWVHSLFFHYSVMSISPHPTPHRWKLVLYLTPSNLVWISCAVMTTVCILVSILVLLLHLREKVCLTRNTHTEQWLVHSCLVHTPS